MQRNGNKNGESLPAFSIPTMEARRQWDNIFKVMRKNNYQPRIGCQEKLPSGKRMDVEIFIEKNRVYNPKAFT